MQISARTSLSLIALLSTTSFVALAPAAVFASGSLVSSASASASSLFDSQISATSGSGGGGGVPVAQRVFRLGRPAAGLNTQAPFSSASAAASSVGSRLYSTMSSVSLPAQDANFPGHQGSPVIEPDSKTAQLIKDAQDLFGAKPSSEIFARSWDPNAIFADPICHAFGAKQYLAQWFGMPRAFSHSETVAWKLIKQEPGEVQYAQKQLYKVKGLGMQKEMISTVVMERNADNKITRFEDRWNHKPLGGAISWPFRRLNALTMPYLVSVPKETKDQLLPKKDL